MNISALFEQIIHHQDLSPLQMQLMIEQCMRGELNDVQIATFLALMRMKGESASELSVAAQTMRNLIKPIVLGDNLIDLVGTGGDGQHTFNISTVSSFVAAAAGANVAKSGNRSVSSKSGSADFLLEAGFKLDLSETQLQTCIQQQNIAFLFAPHFYQAMQYARPARQQLGIRTFFNLLGPMINPARVSKHVIGVFSKHWLLPVAEILANLGSQHALVLHAQDGLDEISICASTDVVEYRAGEYKSWSINPHDYDCFHANLEAIVVDGPRQSLTLAESVFSAKPGPAYDIVVLNSAAAIYCAGLEKSFSSAVEKARDVLNSGLAGTCFYQLRDLTQTM